MRAYLLPIALLSLAASAVVLSACGSDSPGSGTAADRGAAEAGLTPDTTTCPERSPSFDWSGAIVNRVPVAVALTVGEYTCDDWSGVSTPGAVLNGKVLQPAARPLEPGLEFTLEPRENVTRIWTMQFAPADGEEPYGRARVYLKTAGAFTPFMTTPDQGTYKRTWTYAGNTITGWFLRLGPIDAPDTPTSLLPPSATTMGIVVHQGHVAVVTDSKVTG